MKVGSFLSTNNRDSESIKPNYRYLSLVIFNKEIWTIHKKFYDFYYLATYEQVNQSIMGINLFRIEFYLIHLSLKILAFGE